MPQGIKPSERADVKHGISVDGKMLYLLDVPEEVFRAGQLAGFDKATITEKLETAAQAVAKAYAKIGDYDPSIHGSPRQYGTSFHELVRGNIGKDNLLHTELSFKKGDPAKWGQLGSSRIDIGLGDRDLPFVSMCLKTLDAVPSAAQERGWIRNLPSLSDGTAPPRLYLKLTKP